MEVGGLGRFLTFGCGLVDTVWMNAPRKKHTGQASRPAYPCVSNRGRKGGQKRLNVDAELSYPNGDGGGDPEQSGRRGGGVTNSVVNTQAGWQCSI
jgi:hypothetical protein